MLTYASVEELYRAFVDGGMEVCTDTRKIVRGALFFALKGPNFNANSFAESALKAGCSAAVVDDPDLSGRPHMLLVEDGLRSLQDLARFHRRKMSIPVLAITGSNGKTTSKELINAVLSETFSCLATTGNLNNHVGVPLTLLRLRGQHELAIVEMGANHQGEIAALCDIAEPTHGLVTNIGRAHLEGFGGEAGVKKGKSEIYRYLEKSGGLAFIHADDPVLAEVSGDVRRITYGTHKLYDVIGKDCTREQTVSFKFTTRYGEKNWSGLQVINTHLVGRYNYVNCLAAACAGVHFKVPAEKIGHAMESYQPTMNRSQQVDSGRNRLIMDAYNANPDSMRVAIENFAAFPGDRKMVLLGDMFELGEFSKREHEKVVSLLREKNLEEACLVGEHFSVTDHSGFHWFPDTGECRKFLQTLGPRGYTILIKGSRSMKMETLAEVL